MSSLPAIRTGDMFASTADAVAKLYLPDLMAIDPPPSQPHIKKTLRSFVPGLGQISEDDMERLFAQAMIRFHEPARVSSAQANLIASRYLPPIVKNLGAGPFRRQVVEQLNLHAPDFAALPPTDCNALFDMALDKWKKNGRPKDVTAETVPQGAMALPALEEVRKALQEAYKGLDAGNPESATALSSAIDSTVKLFATNEDLQQEVAATKASLRTTTILRRDSRDVCTRSGRQIGDILPFDWCLLCKSAHDSKAKGGSDVLCSIPCKDLHAMCADCVLPLLLTVNRCPRCGDTIDMKKVAKIGVPYGKKPSKKTLMRKFPGLIKPSNKRKKTMKEPKDHDKHGVETGKSVPSRAKAGKPIITAKIIARKHITKLVVSTPVTSPQSIFKALKRQVPGFAEMPFDEIEALIQHGMNLFVHGLDTGDWSFSSYSPATK